MSFRNRTVIAGADGPLRLSIPIEKSRNERQFYKQVKLMAGRWPMEHFRAIKSCYNRSPWFEYYCDELAALYEMKFDYLFDWNLACHNWVVEKLGLGDPFVVISETGNQVLEGIENAVNEFHPGNDRGNERAAISRPYQQVFHEKTGFLAGLSILDLLFCEGPSASKWLKKD